MPFPAIFLHLKRSPLATAALHVVLLGASLYGYTLLIEHLGGFATYQMAQQVLEFGLVLYLYALFFRLQRPWRGRSVLAALPLLGLYLVHDLFYLVYGKVFRLINISEFPELLQVLPLVYSILLLALLLLLLGLFVLKLEYRGFGRHLLWLSPLLLLLVAVKATPDAFANGFEQLADVVRYSDGKSVESNGRLSMLLYHEAERSSALQRLGPFHDRAAYEQQAAALRDALALHSNQRNVHLIVLESFLDPRLFTRLRYSSSPIHPSFDALFTDRLGLAISPMFGGSTAQAEFEVLCGVPAFERLSSVEFNLFSGAAAHCLPGTLKALGYRSVATNTYKPDFFNAMPAYQGMGFSESHFPLEYAPTQQSYLRAGDPGVEDYLFDAPLFDQNLAYVREHIQRYPEQPLFNYVLTIYGHTPHLLNPELRPERITLDSDYADDHLSRAVNQLYYRTEAIADYANALLASDPDSLIIFISDHLPPLRNGPNTYNALGYLENRDNSYYYNRIAILEKGQAKLYPVIYHYELPTLILDYLTDGAYCQQQPCAHRESAQRMTKDDYMERYMRLMAHAAE